MKFLLSVAALFSVSFVFASQIVGTVTKVSDGDTIWVSSQSVREKVRLDRIDAPESNQVYGTNATAALRGLVRDDHAVHRSRERSPRGKTRTMERPQPDQPLRVAKGEAVVKVVLPKMHRDAESLKPETFVQDFITTSLWFVI